MKKFVFLLLTIVGILCLNSVIYAEADTEYASAGIKAAIDADYKLHYADALESKKEDFHAKGSKSSLHTATLGEGIAFYTISDSTDSTEPVFAGYKFPLYLEGKQIGVIDADTFTGVWAISNISSADDLVSKINKAKASVKNGAKWTLIDDKRYAIQSVYIKDENGERFLDLKNNSSSSAQEFNNAVIHMKNENADHFKGNGHNGAALAVGGGGVLPNPIAQSSSAASYVSFLLGVLFLIPVLYIVIKSVRKKPSHEVGSDK